ncbi:DsbA family protein [uncultured Jannaschia sp.]|uniref:DsbA family protein n=1 Tax=uncultured Jannaschia sp. TaxID=293347 RepID=UPI002618280F|nr:DsbA family protein [uncultured Jannaschia sp.]
MTRLIAALAATTCLGTLPAPAQDLTEERVRELALEAILENPQVVMDAVAILQEREAQAAADQAQTALGENRAALEQDPNAPVLGNPEGDVTVVEFFDYNCPYCRRAADEVAALIENDGDVRVVYREWPILGEGSVFASRAALAARAQDKYAELHKAMLGSEGRLDENAVMRIAEEVGLDTDKLRADMEAPEVAEHIDTSMALAQSLGFTGTPSFVIGENRAPGLIDAEQMRAMIEMARDDG